MTLAALLSLTLAAGPAARATDAPRAPRAAPRLLAPAGHPTSEVTPCGSCHTTDGWLVVKFDHGKTGFPLRGQHAKTSCKQCHPADFDAPVPAGCRACHRDPHGGELGARCEGCHDEQGWASRFGADAHRRTAFPLVGAHAALPCEQCHAAAADRRFSREVVECVACHQREYDATRLASLDHARLGFSTDCRQCHLAWAFRPARFPAHDTCYQISAGPHAAVRCANCHSALPTVQQFGACNSGTAACSSCHSHLCVDMDRLHAAKAVAGYQCKDRKCYECHRLDRVP